MAMTTPAPNLSGITGPAVRAALALALVVDGRPGQADHHELADFYFR